MLIARAEVEGRLANVRVSGARIREVASALARRPGEPLLDAAGGALLPGLHDHHLHLLALAAAQASLRCGPPEVTTRAELARALRRRARELPPGAWIRGVGQHESAGGALDRRSLDALEARRPVRIQHRSGQLWTLNSAALERLGLDRGADAAGVERDRDGRATGRLYRLDDWLRDRLRPADPPELAAAGRALSRNGVTGVTDATPGNGPEELALLAAAAGRGDLPQRVVAMGGPELRAGRHSVVSIGPLKLHLADAELPDPDALAARIAAAHAAGRAAALHCVTRAELVVALAAFAAAGARAGDRLEHAAVAPPELLDAVARLPLCVVTQPGFVRERGDAYLADVEEADRPWLWRARGFLSAGVALGGGTDAPFGDPDPWSAMRAAVERRTRAGLALGPQEALSPERALALFTSPPEAPGAPPRRVASGAPADLVLLDRPWQAARRSLSRDHVAATFVRGALVWHAEGDCSSATRGGGAGRAWR